MKVKSSRSVLKNDKNTQNIKLMSFQYLQGFGVAAKSTQDCRHADPMTIVCFHQADIGEYLRSEETLT